VPAAAVLLSFFAANNGEPYLRIDEWKTNDLFTPANPFSRFPFSAKVPLIPRTRYYYYARIENDYVPAGEQPYVQYYVARPTPSPLIRVSRFYSYYSYGVHVSFSVRTIRAFSKPFSIINNYFVVRVARKKNEPPEPDGGPERKKYYENVFTRR